MCTYKLLFVLFVLTPLASVKAEPCATPNSKEGNCIEFEDCAEITALLEKPELTSDDISYLKRAQCGEDVPKMCCQVSNKTAAFKPPPKPNRPITLDFRGDDDESLLPTDCGEQQYLDDKIIGIIASIDEFPWMALLKYQSSQGKGYGCGGALISKKYVLTAAHCVLNQKYGKPFEVRLGEYDINNNTDCEYYDGDDKYCIEPCQDVAVEEVIPHPQYVLGDKRKLNDIALLRLKRSATYTDNIVPICLPDAEIQNKLVRPKRVMNVAGWGETKNRSASNIKRKARVPIIDRNSCSQNRLFRIAETQICAGGGKEDSCTGDSGGPLMARNLEGNDQRWYVTGIVSFGPKPCALKGTAAVYTNVASYIPWIKENIKP